jgi:PAS domain S-box-containing protein
MSDITNSLKDSQDTLLEDAALTRGIADAAPDMLYVIDLRTMEMVYANNRVLALFGKTLEELAALGPSLFDVVVYPADRPAFDAHIAELLAAKNGEVKELTFRLLDANQHPTWVRTRRTVYKRDEDGHPTHVISVSQDISKEIELQEIRQRLEEEKRMLQEQKQIEIFRAILSTQEEERRRISESLHNGLGQLLYGIKLNLCMLDIPTATDYPNDFRDTHQYACQLLEEGIKEARRISHELMPTVLEDFGIKAAIEDACHKMESSTRFRFDFEGVELLRANPIKIAVYRTIQELILNIGKHAEATKAKITLKVSHSSIHIEVADNGVGMDLKTIKDDGIGLKSIKNKIRLLKGTLNVSTAPGNGTKITIDIPQSASTSFN